MERKKRSLAKLAVAAAISCALLAVALLILGDVIGRDRFRYVWACVCLSYLALFGYFTYISLRALATKMYRSGSLRFSLRTVLMLVVLIALPLAWIAKEWRQSEHEQVVARQLRENGFTVTFGGPYTWVEANRPQGWWRDFARQVIGERVVDVYADDSANCEVFSALTELASIHELYVKRTKASDLTPIAKLKSLRRLYLYNSPKVSDSDFAMLEEALPDCYICR